MKKSSLAIALLSVLPLAAQAQMNVTVYGNADAAIGSEDTDAPGVGRRTVVSSGTQSATRIGFRGVEDLGNGLKVLFNFEAGLAIDTGAANAEGLFQRRAVVGLQGKFGTLTAGRELGPISAVAQASDPLGHGFYGSNLGGYGTGRLTRRLSNSVNYKSDAISGFTGLASYSAGERTPNDPSGDLAGAALEFRHGPVYLGAGLQRVERLANEDDRELAFGAGVTLGAFELRASYMEVELAAAAGPQPEFKYITAGASYTFGANKLFLAAHQQRLSTGNAEGDGFTLAYTYSLSKRTNLYSTYAKVRNNATGNFGLTGAGGTFAPPATAFGADPSVFNVGVRHSF